MGTLFRLATLLSLGGCCLLHAAAPPVSCSAPTCTLSGPKEWITNFVFRPDGKQLAALTEDLEVVVWDLPRERVAHRVNLLAFGFHASTLCYSPDGTRLAVAGSNEQKIRAGEVVVLDCKRWNRLFTVNRHYGGVSSVAFSPDSKTLATMGSDVVLFNARTGKAFLTIRDDGGHSPPLRFSPDGKLLLIGTHAGIRLHDPQTGKRIRELNTREELLHIGRNSHTLTTLHTNGQLIKHWDLSTGKLLGAPRKLPKGFVRLTQAWSPDGKLLAYTRQSPNDRVRGEICLRSVATGKDVWIAPPRYCPVYPGNSCLAFSPDGRWLATCTSDWAIEVWDVPAILKKPSRIPRAPLKRR